MDRQGRKNGQCFVGRSQQSQGAADREQAGGGKERGAVLQGRHHLHVHHAGLAIEQVPDPDLAIRVHAGRQTVTSIGRVLQRDGINGPFQHKETDREDVHPICSHRAPLHRMLPRATPRGNRDAAQLECLLRGMAG